MGRPADVVRDPLGVAALACEVRHHPRGILSGAGVGRESERVRESESEKVRE